MSVEVNGILVAAHELKAPLSLMRQLALALEFAETPVQTSRIQKQLVAVSERALRQVEDLAKISQLEGGMFALEPVSVRAVCDTVWREISRLCPPEQRSLKLSYSNRLKLAIANHDLLHSIVHNFCLNAIHYSDSGTTSELSIHDHADKIQIRVRDFGPALPTKIWRQFQSGTLRQPTAIAMRAGSSGLGLYIASEFARHMHAHLGAIRHRDGTSFFLELPASRQAELWSHHVL